MFKPFEPLMPNIPRLETLIGGAAIQNMSPDALNGLNGLALRLAGKTSHEAMMESAMRRASADEKRKLALLVEADDRSPHLD